MLSIRCCEGCVPLASAVTLSGIFCFPLTLTLPWFDLTNFDSRFGDAIRDSEICVPLSLSITLSKGLALPSTLPCVIGVVIVSGSGLHVIRDLGTLTKIRT